MKHLIYPSQVDLVRVAMAFVAWQNAQDRQLPPDDPETQAMYIINAVECTAQYRLDRIRMVWMYMAYPGPIDPQQLNDSIDEWQRVTADFSLSLADIVRSIEKHQPVRMEVK